MQIAKLLIQAINQALELRAQSLFISPGYPVRIKVGKSWRDLDKTILKESEVRQSLLSLMTEEERHLFYEKKSWSGRVTYLDQQLQVQVLISEQGFVANLNCGTNENLNLEMWNLPAHFLDLIHRGRGGHFFVGPKESGKSSLLGIVAKKISQDSQNLVYYYSQQQSSLSLSSRVIDFDLKDLDKRHARTADFIFIDEPDYSQWGVVLDLCDSGYKVVASFSSNDIFSFLQRWQSVHQKNSQQGLISLQSTIGLRLLTGLESSLVPAAEVLFFNEHNRNLMMHGHWSELREEMRLTSEKTGARTLNQSLLQLLLRRRIEMKTAFYETNNPDEFDLMLKKVGI